MTTSLPAAQAAAAAAPTRYNVTVRIPAATAAAASSPAASAGQRSLRGAASPGVSIVLVEDTPIDMEVLPPPAPLLISEKLCLHALCQLHVWVAASWVGVLRGKGWRPPTLQPPLSAPHVGAARAAAPREGAIKSGLISCQLAGCWPVLLPAAPVMRPHASSTTPHRGGTSSQWWQCPILVVRLGSQCPHHREGGGGGEYVPPPPL